MGEISIIVKIADRPYKLLVAETEEVRIQKAANLIEEKIKMYASKYAYKDFQDLLAMVLLEISTEKVKNEDMQTVHEEEIAQKISDISKILSGDDENKVL